MKFLSFLFILFAVGPAAMAQKKGASVKIDVNTKYQYIDGFGGCGMTGQWADSFTQAQAQALWGTADNQVGMNIMRIRINPNEGNWGEYGNAIRWARKVNPNLQVFASPWTPPKKFKTGKSTKYQNEFGTWVWPIVPHSWGGEGSNGGAIDPNHIEDYALFLERYRKTMEDKGCPVDIISIQNECDYTPTDGSGADEHASYESCIFSPKEMARMVKALKEVMDPKCKVMGPECFGWGQHSYNNALANMPDAVNSIDIWGNHIYGTNDWSYINSVTKKTGKHMWQTENYETNNTGNWSEETTFINTVERCINNGFNGYVYYNMLADFFGDGKSSQNKTTATLSKRAYVMGHYTKFATGMTRVKYSLSDSNGGLTANAYVSDSGDTISLFVYNKSSYEYNLTATLPFEARKVIRAATGESVNRLIQDVSADYAGNAKPRLSILPKMFYTFQFIKGDVNPDSPEEFELARSYKSDSNGNPLNPLSFCAEPTTVEYNGRIYLYAAYDQQQYEYSYGLQGNDRSKIRKLMMMSTEDMVNWRYHGTINIADIAPWATNCWAPSIVSREEGDGKTHFYLYYNNSSSGIAVLTSTSPTGPWTDPLGQALITKSTPGIGVITNCSDPGAAIDEEGNGWLVFGGGAPVKDGTNAQPGNARIVKLGSDMISLDGDIIPVPASYHLQSNEINFINGKLVYSYCSNGNASSPYSMQYMIAKDVLAGSWTNKGVFLNNPEKPGFVSHTRLQKLGTSWYLFYQNLWLENQMGFSGGYRNIAANRASVMESGPRFGTLSPTIGGASQITASRVNPYLWQEAELMANGCFGMVMLEDSTECGNCMVRPKAGQWTMVRGVTFGSDGADELQATIKGKGVMEVYAGNMNGAPFAVLGFDNEEMKTVSVQLEKPLTELKNIFFLFKEADGVEWDRWMFANSTGIKSAEMGMTDQWTDTYNLAGQKVGADYRGIVIRNGKKLFIK